MGSNAWLRIASQSTMTVRDIIVIGASAGGFEALQTIVAGLRPDLRASVFITLHQSPRAEGVLPATLNRAGPMPAAHAEDGAPIEMGRIYVAPPDYHLVVHNGFMQLSHGPKENLHRPCINVMFRSAATAYSERVAGVLLTGLLDDGAAGLWEIQQHNGATIVQDPEEATFRSMPDSAIRGLNVQYILKLHEMAPLLTRLIKAEQGSISRKAEGTYPDPIKQVCPDCGGVMTATRLGQRLLEFQCHTGHRFGLETLISQKTNLVERNLYAALAQSEELAGLIRTAIARAPETDVEKLEEELNRRQREQEAMRQLLSSEKDVTQAI